MELGIHLKNSEERRPGSPPFRGRYDAGGKRATQGTLGDGEQETMAVLERGTAYRIKEVGHSGGEGGEVGGRGEKSRLKGERERGGKKSLEKWHETREGGPVEKGQKAQTQSLSKKLEMGGKKKERWARRFLRKPEARNRSPRSKRFLRHQGSSGLKKINTIPSLESRGR